MMGYLKNSIYDAEVEMSDTSKDFKHVRPELICHVQTLNAVNLQSTQQNIT